MALLRRLIALLALAALAAGFDAASAQGVGEYQIKAAYLSKFAPFVEWPAGALPPGAPLQICLAGADPFGPMIDQLLAGETVADHKVQLVRLQKVDGAASACQVLYVRSSRSQSATEALQAVRGKPVLTVTDAAEGGSAHGIVHFVLVSNRVRFELDPAAARAGGLTLSSKLLNLALPPRGGR